MEAPPTIPTPSESQKLAIQSEPGPVLVLAGPGAGKTYCLIERIRFLVEHWKLDPSRVCAFTFTNKAAGEISARLERYLGPAAERIRRGTIHSFCSELLREFPEQAGLAPGFGIADEEYQIQVLRRIEGYRRWHRSTLTSFAAHRFRADSLRDNDRALFDAYNRFLQQRNLLDFDMLILRTADLLRDPGVAQLVRSRWDVILVDEFQDLNSVQYSIVRSLASEHRNIFGVGDDEQSIYSWAGADPQVFREFVNDFGISTRAQLGENRRCPACVVTLARRLVEFNTPIFADRHHAEAERESPFPVRALGFETDAAELAWIIADLRADRDAHGLDWGDYALLYRTHEIGNAAESAFLEAGIPCRLAYGRALAEDPVVAYLIAALRVIASPDDPIHQESFLQVVLPRRLCDDARARAEESNHTFAAYLEKMARALPKDDGDRRKIWRAFYALRNLAALGLRHDSLTSLVDELLSQRVGEYKSVLEEIHDDLSDPAENDEVQLLAGRLVAAFETGKTVWIPRMGGMEIPLKAMLAGVGINRVELGGGHAPQNAVAIGHGDCRSLGLALGLFKALQLMRSAGFSNHFRDFTALDLETTDRDVARAEVVELAAVRVRDGQLVDEFHSLVRPRLPITAGAAETHGMTDADVADARRFEEVWPEFRAFCGRDILVAHNGYRFDFPILRRMSEALPDREMVTYDTLVLARELHSGSARLLDLARVYGVETGQSHRALDDTRALAYIFLALGEAKVARSRKTALDNLLDQLAIALSLSDDQGMSEEGRILFKRIRRFAFGRYSNSLEFYRSEYAKTDAPTATVEDLIERLGGEKVMQSVRAERSAEDRYPDAMQRLRPLLELSEPRPLREAIADFLERVVLSRHDGADPASARVNLLTLHSTKGLEFSRVYIVGVEDTQIPGRDPTKREVEEARRLLYVGMTRTKDRLVLTRVEERGGREGGGNRFLDEMGLAPLSP